MSMSAFIFLCAGQGKRMKSNLPKVLVPLLEKPMLHWIIDSVTLVETISPHIIRHMIFVVGKSNYIQIKQSLDEAYPSNHFIYIQQENPCGTGDAVRCCITFLNTLSNSLSGKTLSRIVILPGDVPTIQPRTLVHMLEYDNAVLVHHSSSPFGCGRIVYDDSGNVLNIIEEKDCDEKMRSISWVNCGIYSSTIETLQLVNEITNDNAANEYYFTDIVHLANQLGMPFRPVLLTEERKHEFFNVNTPEDLNKVLEFVKTTR